MIAFIDFPWWAGALLLLVVTAPAGLAGAAALSVWRARRAWDAVAWAVLGYLLASGASLVIARTMEDAWGRDRTVDSGDVFGWSVAVAVVLVGVAVWGALRRRRERG